MVKKISRSQGGAGRGGQGGSRAAEAEGRLHPGAPDDKAQRNFTDPESRSHARSGRWGLPAVVHLPGGGGQRSSGDSCGPRHQPALGQEPSLGNDFRRQWATPYREPIPEDVSVRWRATTLRPQVGGAGLYALASGQQVYRSRTRQCLRLVSCRQCAPLAGIHCAPLSQGLPVAGRQSCVRILGGSTLRRAYLEMDLASWAKGKYSGVRADQTGSYLPKVPTCGDWRNPDIRRFHSGWLGRIPAHHHLGLVVQAVPTVWG